MNEVQDWPQVVAELKKRLAAKGYPTRLWWIFRDDILQVGQPPRFYYRRPNHDSDVLAQRVFKKGRARGFVRVVAVARFGNRTAATVWYPEVSPEDSAKWGKGAWIKIRNPLPQGIRVPRVLWWLLQWTPSYRT